MKLCMVIPCYNEEDVLRETARQLHSKLTWLMKYQQIASDSKIVFVDDGSLDHTWGIVESLHQEDAMFSGIKLTRNKGHQNALLAGLTTVVKDADVVITMDADLQDDINAIDEMVKKYQDGCDIVYGVRRERKNDSWFKRSTATRFYKFLKFLGVDIVYNHADFRLLSRRAVEGLLEYEEVNVFLRGMIPMIGYPSDTVFYDRKERVAGKTKYTLGKMLSFAFEGITSLSVKPIRFIFSIGMGIFFLSLIALLYFLVIHLRGRTVSGWTSLIMSIWLLGGIQLMAIGVIGEYIGKVYLETKRRPKYRIEKVLDDN